MNHRSNTNNNNNRSWRQRPTNIIRRFPMISETRHNNNNNNKSSTLSKTLLRKARTTTSISRHHRLKDLVVLEIDREGNQEYRNMSLRVLYNYVLSAVSTRKQDCDEQLNSLHCSLLNSSLSFGTPNLRGQQSSSINDDSPITTSMGQQPRRAHHRKNTNSTTSLAIPEEEETTIIMESETSALGQPRRRARKDSMVLDDNENCPSSSSNTNNITSSIAATATLTSSYQMNHRNHHPATPTPNNINNNPSFEDNNNTNSPNCNNNNSSNKIVTYRERLGGYLHPRDMRRLVTPFSASNEPALIVRRHVMLLNIDPLRAIVLRDRLLVLVPDGADSILQTLTKRIKEGHFSLEGSSEDGYHYEEEEALKTDSDKEEDKLTNGGDDDDENNANLTTMENNDTDVSMDLSSLLVSQQKQHDRTPSENLNNDDDDTEFNNASDYDGDEWDEMQAKKWIHLPFELQSMDAVLHTVCSMLSDEASELEDEAKVVITYLLEAKSYNSQNEAGPDMLRIVKSKINEMEKRVQGVIRAINLVLDEDEDLALMNLSRLITHPERFVQPVPDKVLQEESDEPELILEAYLQQSLTNTNALDLVKNEIDTMEDLMNMQLDAIRNRLLYVNTVVSMFSLVIGVGSFIGSLFGMNLTNGMEYEDGVFVQVVVGTCVGIFGLLVVLVVTLYRAGAMPKMV